MTTSCTSHLLLAGVLCVVEKAIGLGNASLCLQSTLETAHLAVFGVPAWKLCLLLSSRCSRQSFVAFGDFWKNYSEGYKKSSRRFVGQLCGEQLFVFESAASPKAGTSVYLTNDSDKGEPPPAITESSSEQPWQVASHERISK